MKLYRVTVRLAPYTYQSEVYVSAESAEQAESLALGLVDDAIDDYLDISPVVSAVESVNGKL